MLLQFLFYFILGTFLYIVYIRIFTPLYKLRYYKQQGVVFPPQFSLIWGHFKFLERYSEEHGHSNIYGYFEDLHKKTPFKICGYFHGGTPLLLVCEPKAALELSQAAYNKSKFQVESVWNMFHQTFTFHGQTKPTHTPKRKMYIAHFSGKQSLQIINRVAMLMLQRDNFKNKDPINLAIEIAECTSNVFISLVFGDKYLYAPTDYQYKGKPQRGTYAQVVQLLARHLFFRQNMTKNVICTQLLRVHFGKEEMEYYNLSRQVKEFWIRIIKEVRDNPSPILKNLFELCESDEEIAEEITVNLFAAGDLTGVPLAHTFKFLIRNKEKYQKAKQEAMNFIKTHDVQNPLDLCKAIENEDINDFYMMRCYMEALRIGNYQPGTLWFSSDKTIDACGVKILPHEETAALLSILNLDKASWQQPYEFIPERFDPESPYYLAPNGKPRDKGAFIPFWPGRRSCVGEPLARKCGVLVGFILLAYYNFEETKPGDDSEEATMKITDDPNNPFRSKTQ